jgi:hypothetical protein
MKIARNSEALRSAAAFGEQFATGAQLGIRDRKRGPAGALAQLLLGECDDEDQRGADCRARPQHGPETVLP